LPVKVCSVLQIKTREYLFDLLKLGVTVLIGIFIFLNPFPHTTAIKETGFYLSVFIVLFLIGYKKINFSFESPLTLPFALFTGWVFIGLFFALDKENSLHDFRAHLLKYLVFYYILINFFHSRKRVVSLSWLIIISVTIFSVGEIYYFYFMLGNSFSTKLVTGLPEIPVNWIGYLTVPAAVFSLHHIIEKKSNLYIRVLSLACLLPLCSLSFLTQARSTTLALCLAVFMLCSENKKNLIVFLLIILIAISISPIKDRFISFNLTYDLRLDIHHTTFEIIKNYPILGIGFGMETYRNEKVINLDQYNQRVPQKYRQAPIHTDPHSVLFSIAVRTGLVGFGLFLYILFTCLKMFLKCVGSRENDFISRWGRTIASAFIAIFFIGNFEPFFSHVPEVVFYTILAMATIVWSIHSGKTTINIQPELV